MLQTEHFAPKILKAPNRQVQLATQYDRFSHPGVGRGAGVGRGRGVGLRVGEAVGGRRRRWPAAVCCPKNRAAVANCYASQPSFAKETSLRLAEVPLVWSVHVIPASVE